MEWLDHKSASRGSLGEAGREWEWEASMWPGNAPCLPCVTLQMCADRKARRSQPYKGHTEASCHQDPSLWPSYCIPYTQDFSTVTLCRKTKFLFSVSWGVGGMHMSAGAKEAGSVGFPLELELQAKVITSPNCWPISLALHCVFLDCFAAAFEPSFLPSTALPSVKINKRFKETAQRVGALPHLLLLVPFPADGEERDPAKGKGVTPQRGMTTWHSHSSLD